MIHVGGGGRTLLGRSVDVSRAGVFVILADTIPQGARVEMMLETAAEHEVIFVTGTVVHVVPGQGVGIRFSALSARSDGRLMALLARLQQAA
jgi:hypothetical protein